MSHKFLLAAFKRARGRGSTTSFSRFRFTLSKRLEAILPLTQDFDCLVGYFFISGFFRLYPALESVKNIRILIGLKNEQVIHGLMQIANDESAEGAPSTAEIKATFAGMMRKELIQAQDTLAIETGEKSERGRPLV